MKKTIFKTILFLFSFNCSAQGYLEKEFFSGNLVISLNTSNMINMLDMSMYEWKSELSKIYTENGAVKNCDQFTTVNRIKNGINLISKCREELYFVWLHEISTPSHGFTKILTELKPYFVQVTEDGGEVYRYTKGERSFIFLIERDGMGETCSVYETFTPNENKDVIKMKKKEGGTYEIPVTINGVLKINFIFDSGASDVSISPDVAMTLIKTGTVTNKDFVGEQTYVFADGSKASSRVFIIKQMEIGNHVITNIRASISNSINAPMLLGQSVLEKFGKITIDNVNQTLIIQK